MPAKREGGGGGKRGEEWMGGRGGGTGPTTNNNRRAHSKQANSRWQRRPDQQHRGSERHPGQHKRRNDPLLIRLKGGVRCVDGGWANCVGGRRGEVTVREGGRERGEAREGGARRDRSAETEEGREGGRKTVIQEGWSHQLLTLLQAGATWLLACLWWWTGCTVLNCVLGVAVRERERKRGTACPPR